MADANKMSAAELEALWKKKKSEESATREAALAVVGTEARKKLEAELPKLLKRWFPDNEAAHSLSLASIFTASSTPRTVYRNPKTGETYSSRGKPPKWFTDMSDAERAKARGNQQPTVQEMKASGKAKDPYAIGEPAKVSA